MTHQRKESWFFSCTDVCFDGILHLNIIAVTVKSVLPISPEVMVIFRGQLSQVPSIDVAVGFTTYFYQLPMHINTRDLHSQSHSIFQSPKTSNVASTSHSTFDNQHCQWLTLSVSSICHHSLRFIFHSLFFI